MKEITFEELYEKLLDSYKGKFPHNPSGVLQFHIDRIVKEKKSKEDALVELSKQAGMEIPENITGKFPEISVVRTRTSVELSEKPTDLDLGVIMGLIVGAMGTVLIAISFTCGQYVYPFALYIMFIFGILTLGFSLSLLLFLLGEKNKMSEESRMGLKSQLTYPKDLITKYREQYPHNPNGVLRWHIDKKMKEGRTREQAIEELLKESE